MKLLGTLTTPKLSKLELVSYEPADDEERLPKTKTFLHRFPALRTPRLTYSSQARAPENSLFFAEGDCRPEVEELDVAALLGVMMKRREVDVAGLAALAPRTAAGRGGGIRR